jgi:serine/threonine protein kinase
VIRALKCLNDNGLHHGDLNCSKIIISRVGRFVVTEHSGFSQLIREVGVGNVTNSRSSSVEWLIDERMNKDGNANLLRDFYGIVCIIFEMMTGGEVFE